ncbi:magnesium-translocating P-type ATPase [Lentzea sp. NPDC004782]|uniref:magnesium-translocating P-type ATPase n=1 Tax=Lentzea sp. NPDC004782 TaxID=3154458 RepID=UPI0033B82623
MLIPQLRARFAGGELTRVREVLQVQSFRRLWLVLGVSSVGDWMGLLATSTFAAGHVGGAAAKGLAFGGVIAVRLLPALVLGPVAGVLADRFDRRRTLAVCDLLRCVLYASIPIVGLVVSVPAVVVGWAAVAVFVVEAVGMVWTPTKEAALPNLLPPQRVETANQLGLVTSFGVTPVLGALVIAGLDRLTATLFGARIPVWADPTDTALYFNALTFLANAAVVYFGIREIGGRPHASDRPGALAQLLDGLAYIRRTPLVRGLIQGILAAFTGAGVVIGTAHFYTRSLGGGDATFYLLFATLFLGLAAGVAGGPSLVHDLSRRRWFALSIGLGGLGVSGFALAPHLAVALPCAFAIGAAAGMALLVGETLLGTGVGDELRGRVFAVVLTGIRIVLLLGISVSSALAGLDGPHSVPLGTVEVSLSTTRIVLLVAGLLTVLAGWAALRSIDDRRGTPVLSDLRAALRSRDPVPAPSVPPGRPEDGLSGAEAARRLAAHGPNRVEVRRGYRGLRLLLAQFTSPIIVILVVATALSMMVGDLTDGLIILAIITASGGLGFWQEHSAGRVVDALLARVRVEVEVLRDGREISVPAEDVVPGDVVVLRAGDIIPADATALTAHDLLVDESMLTGESFPVEKTSTAALLAGTHVVSGTSTALVTLTGRDTRFGAVAVDLAGQDVVTGFERGMTRFGTLLVRAMIVLVGAILVVNVVLDRPLIESLLFSLALAVGLTPQLLPAIVAVSLSAGARRMAAERVIVKRLDAIEDFGATTVLCTDKTGTLTAGAIRLDAAYDLDGHDSPETLRLARLNAGLQHGFPNPLDQAVLLGAPPGDPRQRLDEVPYDFHRKRLSVLVHDPGRGPLLITKGALDNVLDVCTTATGDRPLRHVADQVRRQFATLSAQGYRVLGVAVKPLPGRSTATADDETGMVLTGLLAFHDSAKDGAAQAIADLAAQGISVRLVTGDNRLAAEHIAREVGLTGPTLTGDAIDELDDAGLAARAADTTVFAEVQPLHKRRLVAAFRAAGATVGFLGDGINDAPALHAADVGISVDSAADVAKQAAAIVLLDKNLAVIADGVRMGRRTFANTLKYVRVTISANFGNVLSMAVAAAFLPFLPLLPRQILLLNFLSDIPATTIAGDSVDPEQLRRPSAWNITGIRNFMVVFGLLSSAFDIATFLVLRLVFHADASLFHTGWFIESTATELAVMLVLRTAKPFYRSRPGRALLITSGLVGLVVPVLPYTPLAALLGLVPPDALLLTALAALTVLYVAANELAKRRFPLTS